MPILRRPWNSFGVLAFRRGCRWLLVALGLVAIAPRVDAAGPNLLDYFRACGVGDEAFARFADDRQIAGEELDVIRRIAIRLRDCPAERLRQIAPPETSSSGRSPADAKARRGQMFAIAGSIASVEAVEDQGGEPLWRCTLELASEAGDLPGAGLSPCRAVVYVAALPEKLRNGGKGQPVAVEGVFAKCVPGIAAQRMAVLVAPRLQWRPQSPLADLGMDFGLFEGVQDDLPLMAADHEPFYRLLQVTRNADPDRLGREAERLDGHSPGVAELFRDPASQRGRLVRLSGIARRVVRVPIDEPAVAARMGVDHYVEIDLVSEGSQNNPLVFCTLDLPGGMPLGGPPSYGERVEATGFFLKDWRFPTALDEGEKAANPAASRALQTAPLLIGPTPLWKPAVEKKKTSLTVIGGMLGLAIAGVCLLLWHLRQADREFARRVLAGKR